LSVLAHVVEYRDDGTGAHIQRTQRYFRVLINGLLEKHYYQDIISTWDIPLVLLSSQLHDIGKVAIPDAILLKTQKLTLAEYNEVKKHTVIGEQILDMIEGELEENKFVRYAKEMAVSHHEKWDGTGYPHGLAGEEIPLLGRCMSIVDVYDALISIRPYKRSYTHEETLRIIAKNRGIQFDPLIVDTFLSVADQIYAESQRTDLLSRKKSDITQGTNIDDPVIL
jgi:putative two-component system response regulator